MAAKESVEQVVEESIFELGVQSLKPKQREERFLVTEGIH